MKVEDNLLFVTKVEPVNSPFDGSWTGDVRIVAARVGMTNIAELGETTRRVNEADVPIARIEAVVNVGHDVQMPEVMDRVRLVFEVVEREEQENEGGTGA